MTRYRLPDALGGGEVEAANDEGDYPQVGFDLPGVSNRLWLDREDLVKVEPPAPEEPPVGAYAIGETIAVRLPNGPRPGCEWFSTGGEDRLYRWSSWAELLAVVGDVPIVPLVPDPFAEPVELPWKREFDAGILVVERSLASNQWDVYVDGLYGHITAAEARALARALWAAADQAERAS